MHDFRVTTFLSPTYCELCGGFLWGLVKQGVQCRKCHAASHKGCVLDALTKCSGDRGLAMLVTGPGSSAATVCASDRVADNEHLQRLDEIFWEQVREETEINSLISRQAEQPLSLFQTLPANFMQFTAKLAPVSMVQRGATDIVFWRRPRNSVAAMVVYTMYCLRPNLLLATPLALMIAYIVFSYYNSGAIAAGAGATATATSPQSPTAQAQAQARGLGVGIFGIGPLGRTSSVPSSSTMPAGAPQSPPQRRARVFARRRSSSQSSTRTQSAVQAPDQGVPQPGVGPLPGASSAGLRRRRRSSSNSGGNGNDNDNDNGAFGGHVGSGSHAAAGGTGSGGAKTKVDLGAMLGVASFGSAQYTQNVHTTQTLTGTYVGVYDWVVAHNYLVDWSHPAEVRRILAACIYAQLAVLVVAYVVPPHMLFLAGGNLGMLAMSPHVRAFAKVYGSEAAQDLLAWATDRWAVVRQRAARAAAWRWLPARARWSKRGSSSGDSGGSDGPFSSPGLLAQESSDDEAAAGSGYLTPPALTSLSTTAGSSASTLARRVQTVGVFENQRWWLGLGWVPRLGSNERAKWSDRSGKREFASIRDFMPEDGFEWVSAHDGWEIDRHWALPVRTDAEGWVYSDNFWHRWASAPSTISSYTRRRHWIRRARPISGGDPPAPAAGLA